MIRVCHRPQDFSRAQRIAQEIKKEIAAILLRDMRNPHIGSVSLLGVEVSRDLAHAKVFVTFFEEKEETPRLHQKLKQLQQAAGFIRSRLGQSMQLRVIPALRFYHDRSLANGLHISRLLQQAARLVDDDLKGAERVEQESTATADERNIIG